MFDPPDLLNEETARMQKVRDALSEEYLDRASAAGTPCMAPDMAVKARLQGRKSLQEQIAMLKASIGEMQAASPKEKMRKGEGLA